MNDTTALLDRFWATYDELDDHRPLWDSDIERIEHWPRSSAEHTAGVVAQMLALRSELRTAADEDGRATGEVASLLTAADAAALVAAAVEVQAEIQAVHPTLGVHSYLYWAVNNFPLRTADHGERYLVKVTTFPAAVAELCARVREAGAAGRVGLARHGRDAVDRIDQQLATDVADDPLLQQAPPTELDEDAAAEWRERLAVAVEEHLRPALVQLRDTIAEVVVATGRSDEECGLVHLSGGDEVYAALVEAYTAPGVTAQEVHDTGLARIGSLAEEYRALGASALGTDDLGEVFSRIRDDESLRYGTAEEVVEAATVLHERAVEQAPAFFVRTPTAPCEVRATEHGSIAFYSPPDPDVDRPGVFFFNTSEPAVWGIQLASTVFHEGIPGHHFQLALAIEDAELHDVHRELFLPAFGEGWGLYAERAADEMGLYVDDLERLGMLMADSMRACRLVVDTGIHAFGWGRQQAIDFMTEHAPMHLTAIEGEIDRYIGMPGQATSYMMGRLWIERLRDETRARLGDDFDLARFHDVVLSRGMVSLPALRLMVESWGGGPL